MIVMRIKGGLGNQLFQYAAAYAMAKRLNQPFLFDPAFSSNMTAREYKLPELQVVVDKVVSNEKLPRKITLMKNHYINKGCRILNISSHKCDEYIYWIETKDRWQPEFFTINANNLYIDGYFQSENYFKQYRNDILKQFTPRYKEEETYLEVLKEINCVNSVAVHVRRGDFKKNNNRFHYILDENYYRRAIQFFRMKVDNPIFFWFSDDMDWVNKYIGKSKDFRFVNIRTKHADIDDMMLMKNCNHIVTANSTFSWWAAWLNEHENAIRVVPNKAYGMDGMIPNNWIKLSVK